MNLRSSKVALFAAVSIISAPVVAQDGPPPRVQTAGLSSGQGWGVVSHETVGEGGTAVTLQLGFPGLTIGGLYGFRPNLDVGARFSLNYAYEGMVRLIHPGLKFDLVGRLKLLELERIGIGLNFGLGFLATFAPAATAMGIALPVGIVAGFPIGSALVATFGLDMPMFVTFGFNGGLTFPILAGVGLEYFIDRTLVLTIGTKMGPAINPTVLRVATAAEFAFQAQIGVALKL